MWPKAWPKRMEKLSIHVDVHDAISTLKFSPLWLDFKPFGMLHVAFSITSAYFCLAPSLSGYAHALGRQNQPSPLALITTTTLCNIYHNVSAFPK